MHGPGAFITDRHIELVCTYGGSDIYQPLGVIKCDPIVSSEYLDLANFEKIITIIITNTNSITSQAIAHSHSGVRYISSIGHGVGNDIINMSTLRATFSTKMSGLRMSSGCRVLS
jgi:hypothetical protein